VVGSNEALTNAMTNGAVKGLMDEPTSRVTNGSQNGEVDDGKLVENPLANLDIKVSAVIEVAENLAAIGIEGVHATAEVAAETLEVAVTTLSEIGEVERLSSAESGNADDDAAVRTVIFWVGNKCRPILLLFILQSPRWLLFHHPAQYSYGHCCKTLKHTGGFGCGIWNSLVLH
jgi:hypothetical protein